MFELALRWLADHDPGPSREVTLVHGDFRHGNLIIGPDGVRAVLDWEIAHFGDPMEDLGWICTNSWRFGEIDKPVGGFGSREDLFAGYEEAGRKVYPERVMFWEVMGSLRWGIMCGRMMQRFRNAPDHPMEQAVIGRRPSETEIDLLRLAGTEREVDMQDEPTPTELIKAVADFLRTEITPAIKGHNAFKLRVGINALDLVTRQLALQGPGECGGSRAAESAARHRRLDDGAQPRAGGEDRERRGGSEYARAEGASVADHDGQARGRSAELRVVQEGVGAEVALPVIPGQRSDDRNALLIAANDRWIRLRSARE